MMMMHHHILYRSALALPQGGPTFGPRVSSCHGARDRVLDFGKYKGRMLGTLPSSYLRWVSNNLRAGDFEHWARLADQVLRDPVYNDRIEWEFAEAVLKGSNGNVARFYSLRDGGATAELLEISQRFGWDYEDKAAWSEVDFDLLGTSRGGRIPRVGDRCGGVSEAGRRNSPGREGAGVAAAGAGIEERRRGRRERAMMKMKKEKGAAAAEVATTLTTGRRDGGGGSGKRGVVEGNGEGDRGENGVHSPFPGRESLLRKVLGTRGRRSSSHANGMEG